MAMKYVKTKKLQTRERLLLELTSLPTAAGREGAVTSFLESWTARRRNRLALSRDRYGNIIIARRDFSKACAHKPPLFITAHLDHPAFVVRSAPASGVVTLEFRGGVQDAYFNGAAIEIFDPELRRAFPARITSLCAEAKPFKTVSARLLRPQAAAYIKAGCIARWKFPAPLLAKGILHTHACDDLGGVAAALVAFDAVSRGRSMGHTALLFTRAEEVGFVGAIGAARGGSIPKGARLLCLECSRSFPHDSPIGAGPIVRVGDRLSVFSPGLTNTVADIAAAKQKADPGFRFQRKLMPGGACEATAFASYGISSTCLCLPLGNYHNMADIDGVTAGRTKARVAREYISTADFHGLVNLLCAVAEGLDHPGPSPRDSMEKIWKDRNYIIRN